jgi:hypothetical protein
VAVHAIAFLRVAHISPTSAPVALSAFCPNARHALKQPRFNNAFQCWPMEVRFETSRKRSFQPDALAACHSGVTLLGTQLALQDPPCLPASHHFVVGMQVLG